jgi:aspartate aminotransferase-like enzyme
MRDEGFEIAEGYGLLKEKTFRIGNMGYIKDKDISEMLIALGGIIEELSPQT